MVYRKEEPHCENEQSLGIRAALANRVGRARHGGFAILNKDARKDLRGHVLAKLLTTSDDPILTIAQIMLGSIMLLMVHRKCWAGLAATDFRAHNRILPRAIKNCSSQTVEVHFH
jgi:hypothetical protein